MVNGGARPFLAREALEFETQAGAPRVLPRIGRKQNAACEKCDADEHAERERRRRAAGIERPERRRDQDADGECVWNLRGEKGDGAAGKKTGGGNSGDSTHARGACKVRYIGTPRKHENTKTLWLRSFVVSCFRGFGWQPLMEGRNCTPLRPSRPQFLRSNPAARGRRAPAAEARGSRSRQRPRR